MTESRKVQLSAEMDATGVRRGTEDVKAAVRDMAGSVEQQGAAAAKGVDGIGTGAQAGAGKVDRATKSIIDSVQRTTAAMQAGEKGSAKYYEALATQRAVLAELLVHQPDSLSPSSLYERVLPNYMPRVVNETMLLKQPDYVARKILQSDITYLMFKKRQNRTMHSA